MSDRIRIMPNANDVIDTSEDAQLMFTIPTGALRAANRIDDELLTIIVRLLLGRPVQRAAFKRYGGAVMKVLEMTDLDLGNCEALKARGIDIGPAPLPANVVPLRPQPTDAK